MMDDNASFGYWVRRRRKALDLTQDALTQRVGCSVLTIRKIEGDIRRLSRQIAERLAECLEITAHERQPYTSIWQSTQSLAFLRPPALRPRRCPRVDRTVLCFRFRLRR